MNRKANTPIFAGTKGLRMDINTAEYIGSWQKNADMPHTELPEFAFIGRSNVGKSSLINMLTQRNGLAKTSSTPGKTQSINLFLLNKKIQFVDLPGYGYAKVSKDQREVRPDQLRFPRMILSAEPAQRRVVGLAQKRPGDDVEGQRPALAVALGHAQRRVHHRAVGRERIAQPVLAELRHALDGPQELVRRAGHQQLIVGHAAIAAFGEAGQRQRGLSRRERAAPRIGAGALAGDREVVAAVAMELQAVDEIDHLAGRAVEHADVRRIEPGRTQRRYDKAVVRAVRHPRHLRLVSGRGLLVAEPHAVHVIARQEALARMVQADHAAAIAAARVVDGDPEREPVPARLRHHLAHRELEAFGRLAQALDLLHVGRILEQAHADRLGADAQQVVVDGGDFGDVDEVAPVARRRVGDVRGAAQREHRVLGREGRAVMEGGVAAQFKAIGDLIRRDQERANKIAAMQRLIDEAEEGGVSAKKVRQIFDEAIARDKRN